MNPQLFWRNRSREELKDFQLAKLRVFLSNKVLPFNAFYRHRFEQAGLKPEKLRTFADLQRIPLMDKSDFVVSAESPENYMRVVLQPDEKAIAETLTLGAKAKMLLTASTGGSSVQDQVMDEYLPVHLTFTTGRSANATPVIYSKLDMEILKAAGSRMFALAGISRRHDRALNVFPYAPHLAFWQTALAGFEAGLLAVSTGGGRAMGSQAALRLITAMKPTMLFGTPGYIYHLVQLAQEADMRFPQVRGIVLGAERVNAAYRAKLKEHLANCGAEKVRIAATYGITEAKKAWIQCSEEGRIVTYPDMDIFEIVDPATGKQVAEGEPGELVLTMLSGSGSVFIRYRTGDIVQGGVVYENCPAIGRLAPMLDVNIKRASEIKKVKETLLDLNELHVMLQGIGEVVEWQVELRKHNDDPYDLDEIWLKLALKPGANADELERRVNSEMHARYEIRFDRFLYYSREDLAKLLKLDDAPKELRIVDLRP